MDSRGNFPKRDERVPYSGSGMQQVPNKASKKRKTSGKKPEKRRGGKRTLRIKPRFILIIIAVILFFCATYALTRKNGGEVLVGEKTIGIVKDAKTKAEDLTKTVTAQLEAETGSKIKINETITIKPIHVPKSRKKEVATLDYLMPKIREAVTYQVEAGVITVQAEKVAVLSNVASANEVLEEIKAQYKQEGVELEITFVEKVEAKAMFVDSLEIITKEAAIKKLQDSTEITKTYTAVSNDTLTTIAAKCDMTVEKLLEVNAGLTITSVVKIGQALNIIAKKPFVSVKTVETQVMTEVEEKPYEYQYDSTKNKGYQKVIQQGRAGQKESTKQIIRINGFVEEEKEISKNVTVEPVAEIILQGTK